MAWFGFGKKKEEEKSVSACACNGGCSMKDTAGAGKNNCIEPKGEICSIKVLGAGCAACHIQYENAKEAVEKMGLPLEVEYITDIKKIMEYGVMSMPALVVNEQVVSIGKTLKVSDIEKLLQKVEL